MATSNTRDVELRISATTSGNEQIKELAQQIATLAKEGGAAAPEYQKLAAELNNIAAQDGAVKSLAAIETQLVDTGGKLTAARENLEKLNATFSEQRQKAEEFKQGQAAAGAGVEQLQVKLREAEAALRSFKAAQDGGSKANDEARARLTELRSAVAGFKNELADQKALVATKDETRLVERSLKDAAKAFQAAGADVNSLETQLSDQRKEAGGARDALTALGIAADDLGKAQTAVQNNFIKANQQIAAQQAYYTELRNELERTAAQEREWAELRSFEEKRQQSVKLLEAGNYVRFWTEELAKAEAAEKDLAELQGLEKKRQDAIKLVAAGDYVQLWTKLLEQAEAKERDLQEVQAFQAKLSDAIKLQQATEYVQLWNRLLDDAAQKERDVQELQAFEKKRQDAVKLLQAAEYVRFWTDSLEKAEVAERKLADEARASAQALEDAWAKTGVRSGQAIRAEIESIVASLARLKADSKTTGADFERAFAAAEARVNRLQAELNGVPEALSKTSRSVSAVKDAFRELAAVYGVFELSKGFFDANVQIETLRRSLTLITGSTEAATRQIALLQDVANKSGVSVGTITESFVKFQASLNGAKIPLETTEGLFRAVVNAAGQLGLSSQKAGLILDALAQTANKGVVSMEELRQQLGDSLPGALDLTAKGLKITTTDLVKLVENGKLLAADFLPALRTSLVETFGDGNTEIEGLSASFNRLKNLSIEFAQSIGDSGIGQGLKGAFYGLGVAGGAVLLGLNTALETAFTLTRQLATGIAAIVTGDFKNLSSTLEQIAQDSLDRQAKVVASYRAFVGVSSDTAEAQKAVAVQLGATGQATDSATASTNKLAAANTQVATTAKTAAAAAALAAPEWVKLSLEFQKATEALSAQVKVSTIYAEGVKIEGEARRQLAEIAGDEAGKLRAAAESRTADAEAMQRTAGLRDAEVSLLKAERDQLAILRTSLGDVSGARQEAIDKLTKEIDLKGAEAKKANESAEAARLEALARQVTLKAYQDNSGALAQLASAYATSKVAAEAAAAGERAGIVTKAELKTANERLAASEALYRDAVADTNKNLEANNRLSQAKLTLTEAKLNLERASVENEIALAKSLGNTAVVLDETIKLRQIEIKVIEAKNVALKTEVAATIAATNAERDNLIATGAMTTAKNAEIEARLLAAKAKLLEVDRNSVLIQGIEREIELLRTRGLESNNTANGYVADRGREIDALDAVTAAAERAAAAERKRRNIDAQGFALNTEGQRVNAVSDTYMSAFNAARSQGATDEQARSLANRFFPDGKGQANPTAVRDSNARGGFQAGDLSTAILAEITALNRSGQLGKGQEQAMTERPTQRPTGQQQAEAGVSTGGTYTVNVNLGGNSTSIKTATQADAQALTGLLQSIGQAAGRSGP